MDPILFLLSFVIILISCEFFTNGVEWVGRRFNLSEGAIGSVLAAIGTALPETIIPLIAILFVSGEAGAELGTGAILGAPFMLATLALFVCGLSVLIFRKRRKTSTLHINGSLIRRDLRFFLLAYGLAALAAFLPADLKPVKIALGIGLLGLYGVYLWYTCRTGECSSEELKDLYMCKLVKGRMRRKVGNPIDDPVAGKIDQIRHNEPATWLIILQVFLALAGIIGGSYLFVGQINALATDLAVPVIIVAIIISPLATELPEKFNSMLWIRAKKDTYAIGNITGAMVFQSCIPVTIGLLLTPWVIDLSQKTNVLMAAAMGIALLSGVILYLRSTHQELRMSSLMFGGVLYVFFFVLVLLNV
jgi:cation:H+ antiporter